MAIRTRGHGLEIDVSVTKDGAKRRYKKTFRVDPDTARSLEASIRGALLAGKDPESVVGSPTASPRDISALPLGDVLEQAWEDVWAEQRQGRTQLSNMKACVEFFGADRDMRTIKTSDVDDFLRWMKREKGYAASTMNSKMSTLSVAFDQLRRQGKLDAIPLLDRPKREDNTRDLVYSDEKINEVLGLFFNVWDTSPRRSDGQDGQNWTDWFTFLADTGARPIEARHIDVRNLNGDLLTLVKTKTGRKRTLPLTARALEAVERQEFRHGNEPFAWATNSAHSKAWGWARDELGEDKATFKAYNLRHSFASKLYALTRDIVVVKEWLGHTNLTTTMRYARLFPGALENARDMVQKRLDQAHVTCDPDVTRSETLSYLM